MLNEVSISLDRTFKEFEKEFDKSWKDYEKAVEESYNEFKQKAPFGNDNVDNPGAKKVIKEFR